ncbi:rhomboid family intramembrane serine protease [Flindersiella endophytica]
MTYSGSSNMPGATDGGRRWMSGLKLLALMIGLMWVLEIVDTGTGGALDNFGIHPRSVEGLAGIAAAPFLHFGFGHLISNSIPLLAMGAMIAVGGAGRLLSVTVVVGLISGIGVWLFSAPGSVTIGASGVVFGYALYLVVRGIFNRSALQILVGLVVVFVWGGSLLGGLLPQDGISLQGHLFGAIGGVIAAWLLADEKRTKAPRSAG